MPKMSGAAYGEEIANQDIIDGIEAINVKAVTCKKPNKKLSTTFLQFADKGLDSALYIAAPDDQLRFCRKLEGLVNSSPVLNAQDKEAYGRAFKELGDSWLSSYQAECKIRYQNTIREGLVKTLKSNAPS